MLPKIHGKNSADAAVVNDYLDNTMQGFIQSFFAAKCLRLID